MNIMQFKVIHRVEGRYSNNWAIHLRTKFVLVWRISISTENDFLNI